MYNYELLTDYENEIYPEIVTKVLHLLENLTKSYTISMQMLKINKIPLKCLEKYNKVEE